MLAFPGMFQTAETIALPRPIAFGGFCLLVSGCHNNPWKKDR
jgi:hypothetical protein